MYWKRQSCKYGSILFFIAAALLQGNDACARRYFLMEPPKLNYYLSYEYEKEERTTPSLSREESSETFTEGLDIDTAGWIYHPALLIYDLKLLPEWEQRYEKIEPDATFETKNFLEGYSLSLQFLQNKPYTLSLFGNRTKLTINSNFAQSSRRETDKVGAGLRLRYRTLPTSFDYVRSKTRQTGFFDFGEDQDSFSFNARYGKHLGRSNLRASYLDTNTRTGSQRLRTTEKKVDLNNRNKFGDEDKMRLDSDFNYRQTEGDFFELTRFSASENLLWQHLKNLSTNYNLRYQSNEFGTSRSETGSAAIGLSHFLYENLTTSVSASGAKSESDAEDELKYEGRLNLNYVRKVPWGKVNIVTVHSYTVKEEDRRADLLQVSDEPVTLTSGVVTLLANEDIDVGSVKVFNVARTQQFVEGSDYALTEAGSFLRIICLTGGNIDLPGNLCSTGAPVVVDYQFNSRPSFDFSTFFRNYRLSLNFWSAWNIYLGYGKRTEKPLSGNEADGLVDDEVYTAGTDLSWKWSRTSLTYTNRNTTSTPSEEWNATESLTFRPLKNLFINLSGHHTRIKFKDTLETEKVSNLTSTLQTMVLNRGRLTFNAFLTEITGATEDTVKSGFSALLELAYRRLRGSLKYTFSDERDNNSEEKTINHIFMVEIQKRQF